jgi:hypothetical protein
MGSWTWTFKLLLNIACLLLIKVSETVKCLVLIWSETFKLDNILVFPTNVEFCKICNLLEVIFVELRL